MIRSMACTKLGTKCEAFQREGQKWVCTTGLPSDVVIDVGEMSFHLHKFPLLERSGLLGKMIAEFPSEEGTGCVLQLTNIPGGAKAFELVAKFCYGIKQELNAQNVVSLRCAAEHLQMTEDYGEGNLIAQTENFLNKIFSGWKDTIKALKSCEDLLPYAEELHIISRCINSLALKACTEPNLWMVSGGNSRQSPDESTLWNGIDSGDSRKPSGHDWWYEDVTCLRLPLYKRLIIAMEAKGMKPESLAGALVFYAKTYLPTLNRQASFQEGTNHLGSTFSAASESDQRVLLEEIVNLLPSKKNVTSTKCLLSLLCNAIILQASPSCRENLEKRVGAQLDQASLEDLIVPNMGYSVETLYDVDCIRRILDHFLLSEQSQVGSPTNVEEGQLMGTPSLTPMTMVAKLIDGYLAEVASDVNLKFPKFQSIAAAIPDYARPVDDGIYRAIDIYLKAHPWLSDSEREQLCRLMNCQKLSLEACTHAAQNERLPLRVVVQVLFFEQLRLRTSIAGWFFVSDNHENTQTSHGNLALPKNDGPTQLEGEDEIKAKETKGKIDMKEKVLELEKECMNIKQEIEKLGKKSNSSILSRILWFKSRSPSHECTKSS